MANTRNKVAIVFDGVVCRGELRSSVVTAAAWAVGMTALGHPWLRCCRVRTPVRTVVTMR
ncbi:MAG: hypothetical protein FWH14_06580 [Oscillospiraceae bacterium]|nr:hypothetical protein [Oscillospiraceae bacterium]